MDKIYPPGSVPFLCPKCSEHTKLTKRRIGKAVVRRWRVCLKCGYRFSTIEIFAASTSGYQLP